MSEKTGYKVKEFKLDRAGVGKILKSDGVKAALVENAGNVGNGNVITSFVGFDRVHVLVGTGEEIEK